MKLLALVADSFEDSELIATIDVLIRGGDEVILASMMGRKEVKTKLGLSLTLDTLIEDIDASSFDGLLIPGGPGSFKVLAFIPRVDELIKEFAESNRLVASICAAPFLVGRLGYFKDRDYTVFPGFEKDVIGGNYLHEEGVVVRDNFISAKSMYYSFAFGLAIHEYFHGKESRDILERSCQGER